MCSSEKTCELCCERHCARVALMRPQTVCGSLFASDAAQVVCVEQSSLSARQEARPRAKSSKSQQVGQRGARRAQVKASSSIDLLALSGFTLSISGSWPSFCSDSLR